MQVEMQYAADLADPLLDIRDVVESFRSYQVILPGWDETLRRAVAALTRLLPQVQVDALRPGLLSDLGALLAAGLDRSPSLVDKIAIQVANILDETPIPGIPGPDDDWSFGEG